MTKLESAFADLRTIDAAMYSKMNERMRLAAEYGQLRRLRAEAESQDVGRQLGPKFHWPSRSEQPNT